MLEEVLEATVAWAGEEAFNKGKVKQCKCVKTIILL